MSRTTRARVAAALVAAGLLALGVAGLSAWRRSRDRETFRAACADADAGHLDRALARLEALEAAGRGASVASASEFAYRLGSCRWGVGRRDDADRALATVSADSPRYPTAAALRAERLIDRGEWRAAETLLRGALPHAGRDALRLLAPLERLLRMQARFTEAAGHLRAHLTDLDRPVAGLKTAWRSERGTPPFETIREALDVAQRLAPREDRVWLGRARWATQTGRLDEADRWLKRCEAHDPDAAVRRSRLEWARAAGRADEAAAALRALGPSGLTPSERLEWRAWFARQACDPSAERDALRASLLVEPHDPQALSRLIELSAAEPGPGLAPLRAAKAEVDRALDAYAQAMAGDRPFDRAGDRLEMARLASRAGRSDAARAWLALAAQADPSGREVGTELARFEAAPRDASSSGPEPWEVTGRRPAGSEGPERNEANSASFHDDARAAGLEFTFHNGETPIRQMPVALSGGVGLIDLDGDGHLDVYAVQGGPFPPPSGAPPQQDRLFRNRGDGTFRDVTGPSGLGSFPGGYGQGVAVGDVDGDGHPDLFVTRWRSYALYRNKGDGTFEDATERWGLAGDRDWPTSAAFADLDGDGDLDLYVCHYLVWDETNPRLCTNPGTNAYVSCSPKSCAARPDHLFRNDGGKFTDVSDSAGVTAADSDGRGLGVVAADLDDDGKIDLFVANDKSSNFLFRNLGGMRFEEVAHAYGVAGNAEGGYQAGMGVACGDFDGDGRIDLAVTNYYGESTTLYRNAAPGVFLDATASSGLGAASRLRLGFGAAALDADNDGRLDLLTANGHTDDLGDAPYRMPAQLLLGRGRGRLTDATEAAGPALTTPRLGRGLAAGDLDDDGRVDALLVGQNEPLAYLHNRTERAGHWVAFQLEGTASNRDGVGATVTLDAGGRRQTAVRFGGGSYLAAGDPRVRFGLGPRERVTAVTIHWPSGRSDVFRDVPADAVYRAREGGAALAPVSGPGGGRR